MGTKPLNSLVPKVGVEPTRPLSHRFLRPTRLPIPPLRHLVDFDMITSCSQLSQVRNSDLTLAKDTDGAQLGVALTLQIFWRQ